MSISTRWFGVQERISPDTPVWLVGYVWNEDVGGF